VGANLRRRAADVRLVPSYLRTIVCGGDWTPSGTKTRCVVAPTPQPPPPSRFLVTCLYYGGAGSPVARPIFVRGLDERGRTLLYRLKQSLKGQERRKDGYKLLDNNPANFILDDGDGLRIDFDHEHVKKIGKGRVEKARKEALEEARQLFDIAFDDGDTLEPNIWERLPKQSESPEV
jgi:hypothetical protein